MEGRGVNGRGRCEWRGRGVSGGERCEWWGEVSGGEGVSGRER